MEDGTMNLFAKVFNKLKNRYLRHFIYSAAAIYFCLLIVTITGWGLFSSTVSAGKSVIEAAVYGVEVEISDEDGNTIKTEGLVSEEEYTLALSPGKYNITLAADGTVSEKVSGYGKVVIGSDNPRYTMPMHKGDRINFTVMIDQETDISFSFGWGSLNGEGDIADGDVIDKTAKKLKSAPTTAQTTTQTTIETLPATTGFTTTQTAPTTTKTEKTAKTSQTAGTSSHVTTTATTSTQFETTTGSTTTTGTTDIE